MSIVTSFIYLIFNHIFVNLFIKNEFNKTISLKGDFGFKFLSVQTMQKGFSRRNKGVT